MSVFLGFAPIKAGSWPFMPGDCDVPLYCLLRSCWLIVRGRVRCARLLCCMFRFGSVGGHTALKPLTFLPGYLTKISAPQRLITMPRHAMGSNLGVQLQTILALDITLPGSMPCLGVCSACAATFTKLAISLQAAAGLPTRQRCPQR